MGHCRENPLRRKIFYLKGKIVQCFQDKQRMKNILPDSVTLSAEFAHATQGPRI